MKPKQRAVRAAGFETVKDMNPKQARTLKRKMRREMDKQKQRDK